jgi:hypothetical protein
MAMLAFVVVAGPACSSMSEAQRNAFATRFLESFRDNTEYYREYLLDRDAMQAEAARSSLAGGFTIKGWSGPFGPDECYVETRDGTAIVLYVIQAQRKVKEVGMVVRQAAARNRR